MSERGVVVFPNGKRYPVVVARVSRAGLLVRQVRGGRALSTQHRLQRGADGRFYTGTGGGVFHLDRRHLRNPSSPTEDAARWSTLAHEGSETSVSEWRARRYPLFHDRIASEALQAIDELGGEGVEFSFDRLRTEMQRVAGQRGRPLAWSTLTRRLGRALEQLIASGFVRRVEVLRSGGESGFALTLEGSEAALASRVVPAERSAEESTYAGADEIADQYDAYLGSKPRRSRARRSSAAACSRPGRPAIVSPHEARHRSCRSCARPHRLSEHRGHAVDAPATCPNPPSSKLCAQGRHAWDVQGGCTRKGCTASLERGQGTLFGYDPTTEAEVARREKATGQHELFRGEHSNPPRCSNPLLAIIGNPPKGERYPGEAEALARSPDPGYAHACVPAGCNCPAGWKLAQYIPGQGMESFMPARPVKARDRRGWKQRRRNTPTCSSCSSPIGIRRGETVCTRCQRSNPLTKRESKAVLVEAARSGRRGLREMSSAGSRAFAAGRAAGKANVVEHHGHPTVTTRARRMEARFTTPREPNPAPASDLASVPGMAEAVAHNRLFHDAEPRRVRLIRIDDGKRGVTRKAVSLLGKVTRSMYAVDSKRSNKHGPEWDHKHRRGREPLEVYDPATHTTIKVLEPGTGPSDWWRG